MLYITAVISHDEEEKGDMGKIQEYIWCICSSECGCVT